MSDFEILRNLIRDDAQALVEYEYNKKTIVLQEPGDRRQRAYSLKIRNSPDEIIAFKADAFPPAKDIFRNSRGECKRADFILIASDDRVNWIVCIEMKSGNTGSATAIEQQLRGAQCLVAYCRAIGQEFWRNPRFLKKTNYQQRFVSVKNIGIDKRPTRIPPPSGSHDAPERMLKFNAPAKGVLQFKSLVGSRRH
ncbi:MAG: hypothetical protein OXR72_12500 [Gemmatimonadota bacterium]|nr:hypothetical protein [Gemmatimonadota bacterium]